MRGRTLNNAFVILDEAQKCYHRANVHVAHTHRHEFQSASLPGTSPKSIFLRINAPAWSRRLQALKAVPGIAMSYFTDRDVVRHALVRAIINAYQQHRERPPGASNDRFFKRSELVRRGLASGKLRRRRARNGLLRGLEYSCGHEGRPFRRLHCWPGCAHL